MRKHIHMILLVLVLAAAGFAGASIVTGGSMAALLEGTTTGSTSTPTSTTPSRKVALCHRTHSKKHPWQTIVVSQSAVAAHLRHGDTLGACTAAQTQKPAKTKGKGKSHGTTAPTTTTSGTSGHGHGKGK